MRGFTRLALAVSAVLPICGAEAARADFGLVPAADPIVIPAPQDLEAASAAIEKATGAKAEPIEAAAGEIPLSQGRAFALDSKTAARLVTGSHAEFRKSGLFLFRLERSFGLPGEKDRVAVLAAAEWEAAVRRVGTAGPRRGVRTDQVVAWLREIEKEEPFDLWEIGVDYVAGRFRRAPRDPLGLARRAAKISPDLVVGHTDPIAGLADLMGRNRNLYLIWE
ncbi:MAG TPA: DUF4253 domain-containing protein [Anaeromyxobacteraceae bacterium]|nr:DUF4253 domain-containing protein [Anaeromyxobacteraceae bacterium]